MCSFLAQLHCFQSFLFLNHFCFVLLFVCVVDQTYQLPLFFFSCSLSVHLSISPLPHPHICEVIKQLLEYCTSGIICMPIKNNHTLCHTLGRKHGSKANCTLALWQLKQGEKNTQKNIKKYTKLFFSNLSLSLSVERDSFLICIINKGNYCCNSMWLCMRLHGVWLYGSNSFMWHQPCQCCEYTASMYIFFLKGYKKLVTHVEWYASAVSLLKSGE